MSCLFRRIALLAGLLLIPAGAGPVLSAWSGSAGHAETAIPADPILTAWIINDTGQTNPHWSGVPVNVQAVQQISINGVPYAAVSTHSIANYDTTMTANLIQELNSRPRASTDFRQGHTTATVGQVVRFGDDIGYRAMGCALGYWPPGPGCPAAQNRTANFPMQPLRATQTVSTTLGAIGLWIDGTAVYNWSDAQSYNNGHVWWNAAMAFEAYDMDICPGHAAMGDYHHHSYSDCLAQLVNDTGTGHSPVYGFAADGYPIYGPWENQGVLVQSGWRPRDYDDPTSPTGCGVAHVRNCLLRNPLDPSQGTAPSGQTGPRTDTTVTTMSGNVISATSGIFMQDYWFDTSCGTCLDEHNGHDAHDGRGYHYHVTAQAGPWGHLVPVFPYVLGPTYAGQLQPSVTYTPTPTGPTGTPVAPTTTRTATPVALTATRTPGGIPPTGTPVLPSPTPPMGCTSSFNDVTTTNPFYPYIQWMVCRGTISGYSCGGPGEPCPGSYFRPANPVTRGQLLKMVVLTAGWPIVTPATATFEDVPATQPFYPYIETGVSQQIISGYTCGGAGEPCVAPGHRPYFRSGTDITRGQLAKVIALARGYALTPPAQPTFADVPTSHPFRVYIEAVYAHGVVSGYTCGGPGEPCPGLYFRPANDATRGQVTKFVTLAYGGP